MQPQLSAATSGRESSNAWKAFHVQNPQPLLTSSHCRNTSPCTSCYAALLQGLVEDAREKGAEFLTEWRRENNLIAPVLLDRVTPDMRIAWEEPFGPVLPVLRVGSIDEAVHHCNSSNLGLQGCVFSRDINTAMRVSDAMQTGTVQVNAAPARGPDHFPFQGFRDSGIGSQGIKNSLAMMTKIKSTVINLDKESYTLG
jgi:glyceraldehyde-3-phosphate dehydrogenase (NADP+)